MKERALAALLLALLAGGLLFGLRSDGLTIDELVYIGSGYRHLAFGDYRANPEQPPLAKIAGALPLKVLAPSTPDWEAGDTEWSWSYRFVHVANDASRLIAWARVPNVVFTLVLAWLLWYWARGTHGPAAGLAALVLVAFQPSLLALGHLFTTDLPGALTMTAASFAFWRWSRAPGPLRAALVGAAVGVAVATRLTGWLLLPTFLALTALLWARTPTADRRTLARHVLVAVAALAVLAPTTIWAAYGFRYAPWPGESVAQAPGPWLGATGRVLASLQSARILPEAYLEGMRFVAEHNRIGHPTYLLGRMSSQGWPHYYLVAFLVKNTPGFLLATLLTVALVLRRGRELLSGCVEAHWLAPGAILFLAASFGHIQIGERYILPVYPYLILLAASVVPRLLEGQRGRILLTVLVALHVIPSLVAAPGGHLSYFNVLAGGRRGGHHVLLDSNLDWGQDLPRLAAWMKSHGLEQVQLGYHGSDRPQRLGIQREDLPGLRLYPAQPPKRWFSGTVVVSPNLLQGIFYPPGANPYGPLLARRPDDRAGVFFIYRLP